MKTSKLVVVASILVIAIIGISLAPELQATNYKQVIHIDLADAVQDIDLVRAMHLQLNSDFLQRNQVTYTQHVYYNNMIVCIHGTYSGWMAFFRTQPYIQATDITL